MEIEYHQFFVNEAVSKGFLNADDAENADKR